MKKFPGSAKKLPPVAEESDDVGGVFGLPGTHLPEISPKATQNGRRRSVTSRQVSASSSRSRLPALGSELGDDQGHDHTATSLLAHLEACASAGTSPEEDLEGLQRLLKHCPGQAVNASEASFGLSPLAFAANSGSAMVAKLLLDEQADVNAVCKLGNTALHLAARGGHTQLTEVLVARGAALDGRNAEGWTPMIWAAMSGREGLIEVLLAAQAEVQLQDNEGRTALMWATRHGHVPAMRHFLALGGDLTLKDYSGQTVMHHARQQRAARKALVSTEAVNSRLLHSASAGDLPGVKQAIAAGATVNITDSEGASPLLWAAARSNNSMVGLLLSHGADPGREDSVPGGTQLLRHSTLRAHSSAIAEVLRNAMKANRLLLESVKEGDWTAASNALANGAFVEIAGKRERSPLMWAAIHGAADAVVELVKGRAALDRRDVHGWTALHWATNQGAAKALSALHHCGADVLTRTYDGDTPQHLAVKNNDDVMLIVLRCAGADMNVKDLQGHTPIQVAAIRGCAKALNTLVALQADAEVRDAGGRGVFSLAVANGQMALVEAMLAGAALMEDGGIADTGPSTPHSEVAGSETSKKSRKSKFGKSKVKANEKEDEQEGKRKSKSKRTSVLPKSPRESQLLEPGTKRSSVPSKSPRGSLHSPPALLEPPGTPAESLNGGPQKSPRASPSNSPRERTSSLPEGHTEKFEADHDTMSLRSSLPNLQIPSDDRNLGSSPRCGSALLTGRSAASGTTSRSLGVSRSSFTSKSRASLSLNKRGDTTDRSEMSSACESQAADSQAVGSEGGKALELFRHAAKLQATLPPGEQFVAAEALREVDNEGRTALVLAAQAGHLDILVLLLESKAAVDTADLQGNTALMLAAAKGARLTVELLLAARADVEATNLAGLQPAQLTKDSVMRRNLEMDVMQRAVARHLAKVSRGSSKGTSASKASKEPHALESTAETSVVEGWSFKSGRFRLDCLPRDLAPDEIEDAIRQMLKKRGLSGAANVEVVVHPITQQPRGHAYVDFGGEDYKADALATSGAKGAKDFFNGTVQMVRESVSMPSDLVSTLLL
ncbi:unnamed protein product [Polarella glacialis]|uniref:Uncharacterized protein n=1 Tax=Polarella glacialis TaxID=89957 RepID=A0A813LXG8_POLGL|nr:unnamed protein product [Polarella glacialis]CAE8741605.1 unnamed protein product [Polarella glacialis]